MDSRGPKTAHKRGTVARVVCRIEIWNQKLMADLYVPSVVLVGYVYFVLEGLFYLCFIIG